jgi:hypothetical protein
VEGDWKATRQNTLHLQENSTRIDLEAKQDPCGVYFKYENQITKELKKNQLSDQEID